MQKAADALLSTPQVDGTSGMAAVVGLAPEQVEELIAKWAAEGLKDLYAANINSPRQLVVSGTAAALTEAETRFKEAGAKRVIRLQVAGPFHSPLMAKAAAAFAPVLESVTFHNPFIPVFSNVTGKRITSGEEAKKLALLQITHPVRWVEEQASVAAAAAEEGAEICLEVGPGKVLQGLWKDSGSEIPCYPAGTVEDISKIGG
jgi:[acyl-carrier-protein] S-malonyltransferase